MRKWILSLLVLGLVGCASFGGQDKEKSDLYLRMGVAHMESGNYPSALRDLQTAEQLNPKSPVVQNNLGLVYFMRQRYELSIQHLHKAIELQSDYSDARNNLARVLIEQGQYPEAEKQLKIVINDLTYGNMGKAYINLGLSKFNQKQYTMAMSAFEKALEAQPGDCVATSYRGRSLFELKRYDDAAEILDRAIGLCQKTLYDEPHFYSALAYYRLGDRAKATARFEELIKYYPDGAYRDKAKGMLELIRKGN
jgi:tetratricopeptide (TPR) repeat protein